MNSGRTELDLPFDRKIDMNSCSQRGISWFLNEFHLFAKTDSCLVIMNNKGIALI